MSTDPASAILAELSLLQQANAILVGMLHRAGAFDAGQYVQLIRALPDSGALPGGHEAAERLAEMIDVTAFGGAPVPRPKLHLVDGARDA